MQNSSWHPCVGHQDRKQVLSNLAEQYLYSIPKGGGAICMRDLVIHSLTLVPRLSSGLLTNMLIDDCPLSPRGIVKQPDRINQPDNNLNLSNYISTLGARPSKSHCLT